MKRRSLLWGSTAAIGIAGVGAALAKPRDIGAPHTAYFRDLNDVLRRNNIGRPVMVLDLDRVERNTKSLTAGIDDDKTYRIVVKSLPSIPLLEHVMRTTGTNALMVFHQPFLNAVAESLPDSDVLIGKPMPVSAVEAFYRHHTSNAFNPAVQIQWLVDSPERLEQYLAFAKTAGIQMRINLEIDVGLHRGGFEDPELSALVMQTILDNPQQLSFGGLMGYEPHLAGVADSYEHPALQGVIKIYDSHLQRAKALGVDPEGLTLNGAGSHTLPLYRKDRMLNDLSAGSAIVKPSDFDTPQLTENVPALFIATPVLKHYNNLRLPGDNRLLEKLFPVWNPNTAQMYFIYGGYWKAQTVSPQGLQDWLYHSTNQQPLMASNSVDLAVDDYVFLRPTQSEHVMLQFGDLIVMKGGEMVNTWPVFSQTG